MEYIACAGAENKFRIDLTCNVHVCVSVCRDAYCCSLVCVRTSVLYKSVRMCCAQDSISVTMQVYCMCMCCMCDKYMVSGCVHNNVCAQVCTFMYMYTL